jgi:hypothetical protein
MQAQADGIDVLPLAADHPTTPQASFGHRADHRLCAKGPLTIGDQRGKLGHRRYALVGLAGVGLGRRSRTWRPGFSVR